MQQGKVQKKKEIQNKQVHAGLAENFLWEFGFEYDTFSEEIAFLYMRGDSMAPRILNGDLVYIALGSEIANGAYAAVSIDGERAGVYRVFHQERGTLLCTDNKAFPMRFFPTKEEGRLRIFGKVVQAKRNL